MTRRPAFRWFGVAAFLAGTFGSQGQTPPNIIIPAAATIQPVTAAEYFFNSDPGFGNGTPLAITMGNTTTVTQAIPTAGLNPGVYRYCIRAKDVGSNWGLTTASLFFVLHPGLLVRGHDPLAAINKAEYFFNTDPGFGNGQNIPVTSDTVTTLANLALNITGLSQGSHRLFVRVRDQQGRWSITSPGTLNIIANITLPPHAVAGPIVNMEYFFDTDPGFANATSLAITPGNDVTNSGLTDISTLSVGLHRYFARAQDQKGNWSQSQQRTISIITATIDLPAHPAPEPVSALEYFVDTDPGFGNGTIVPVTATTDLSNYNLTVAVPGLADGTHRLWVRAMKPYSHSMVKTFYVGTPLPLDFIQFSVAKDNNNALVHWEIAENYSTGHFEVERSTDGKHFSSLGTVAWNSAARQYDWLDGQLAALHVPVVYYRIKSVVPGASARYTNVLSLRLTEDTDPYAYVFPNPVKELLKVHFNTKEKAELKLLLTDNNGKVIIQQAQQGGNAEQEIAIDLSGYAAGIYTLSLKSGNWQKNLKVIKQ